MQCGRVSQYGRRSMVSQCQVVIHQATGSGARANRYAHSQIPVNGFPGIGNRLEIVGNANAFDQTNQNFTPPPPAEFFIGGR